MLGVDEDQHHELAVGETAYYHLEVPNSDRNLQVVLQKPEHQQSFPILLARKVIKCSIHFLLLPEQPTTLIYFLVLLGQAAVREELHYFR